LRPLRHLACDGTSTVGVCPGRDGLAAQRACGATKAFAPLLPRAGAFSLLPISWGSRRAVVKRPVGSGGTPCCPSTLTWAASRRRARPLQSRWCLGVRLRSPRCSSRTKRQGQMASLPKCPRARATASNTVASRRINRPRQSLWGTLRNTPPFDTIWMGDRYERGGLFAAASGKMPAVGP
jgi:hypothetical protein